MEILEQPRALAVNDRIDNEAYFNELLKRPAYAWPTIALVTGIVTSAVLATSAALLGWIPYAVALLVNAICSYASYTVVHEAAHGLISKRRWLNDWIGRVGLSMVTFTPFFRSYRFLHITHHRHTNDPEKDPDISCAGGRWWTLPLRWAVMDIAYIRYYIREDIFRHRPRAERREFWIALGVGAAVLITVGVMGWWLEFLLYYILPTRIGIFMLAIAFDFLPHVPQACTSEEDEFRATNNRVGMEWLLTPLFIGQNYHLAHHVYPEAPFFRYRKIWEARKSYHEAKNPALVPYNRLLVER